MSRLAECQSTFDDRTVVYILETQRPFEDLRHVSSQLAGLLVLSASGAKSAGPHHLVLEVARQTLAEAADRVQRAQPTDRAREHHRHLSDALTWIAVAVTTAHREWPGRDATDIDRVLRPLRLGYAHLQQAADRLPGFALIAFSRGCCAVGHAGVVAQTGGSVGSVGGEL